MKKIDKLVDNVTKRVVRPKNITTPNQMIKNTQIMSPYNIAISKLGKVLENFISIASVSDTTTIL